MDDLLGGGGVAGNGVEGLAEVEGVDADGLPEGEFGAGVLAGLTPAQIEGGMKARVSDPKAEFLPKPGKLADLARQSAQVGRWMRAYNRAQAAVVASQKPEAPALSGPKHSPAEVRALVAETLAALSETPTAKMMTARKAAMPRTPSAPLPPGSHMSAEMRAKLGLVPPAHTAQGEAA